MNFMDGGTKTMLGPENRRKLIEHLGGMLASGSCQLTLLNALPQPLGGQLSVNGSCNDLVAEAVRICEAYGYQHTPPKLVTFLENLETLVGGAVPGWWRGLLNSLSTPPQPTRDPFADIIIRDDIPFLDRAKLRTDIKTLLRPNAARPVFAVDGPRYCGKSLTVRFIDHLCRNLDRIAHCVIEVAEDHDRPTVLDVARDMMTLLGGDPSCFPPQDTNEVRWAQELANTVWRQVTETSRMENSQWVIILDGFNRERNDKLIAHFVQKLATSMKTGVGRRHRLVLIDFDVAALTGLQHDIQRITLSGMTGVEMRAEVVALMRALGRTLDTDVLVEKVMQGFSDPLEDLRTFGERCENMMRAIGG